MIPLQYLVLVGYHFYTLIITIIYSWLIFIPPINFNFFCSLYSIIKDILIAS